MEREQRQAGGSRLEKKPKKPKKPSRFTGQQKIMIAVAVVLALAVGGVLAWIVLLASTKPILGRGYLYPICPFDGKALLRLLIRQPISRKNS